MQCVKNKQNNINMKRIFKYILIFAFVGLFIYTLFFLYSKSLDQPVFYKTEKPVVTNILKKTVATGTVVPRKEIEIKPQVSGIIEKVFVEAGQKLKKGDIIARVKIIPDMVRLNDAEARLERAKLGLVETTKIYKRQQQLFEKQIVAQSKFEEYEAAFLKTKTEVEAAENNLELIKEGSTKKMKGRNNTLIRSTIEGMILDVPIKEGNSVIESNTFNAGTTIAIIADMGEMIFKGFIDETEVGKINAGMDLILTIGAIEKQKFGAELEYISPKGVADNGAIQFEIRAAIVLKDSLFVRAGYSANAEIVLDRRDNVLAVNEGLIKYEKDTAFVEVKVGEQQYEKRYIKTGL